MYGPRYIQWPAPARFQDKETMRWCKIPVPLGEVIAGVTKNTNEALLSWENTQPYFAGVARMHFNLSPVGEQQQYSEDMEYLMAYIGYQSIWFADDTGQDYDHNAALIDLLSLEDALKRLKGRLIVAGSNHHEKNRAANKREVTDTGLDWENIEDEDAQEYAAYFGGNGCCGLKALPAPTPKVIPQAEEINPD